MLLLASKTTSFIFSPGFALKDLGAITVKSVPSGPPLADLKTTNQYWAILGLLYHEKSYIEAVRSFYALKGKLNFRFIEAMQLGKTLRENVDYYGYFDKESAKEMLDVASDLIVGSKKILKK